MWLRCKHAQLPFNSCLIDFSAPQVTIGQCNSAASLSMLVTASGGMTAQRVSGCRKHRVSCHGSSWHQTWPTPCKRRVLCSCVCRGMLPTSMSDMWWLRGQIREIMWSTWDAVTKPAQHGDTQGDCLHQPQSFKPDLIIANQLAYGQVSNPPLRGKENTTGSCCMGVVSRQDYLLFVTTITATATCWHCCINTS